MKLAKVRITRPSAGASSPVERATATTGGSMTGLDHLTASQKAEAASHDAFVRDYTPDMLEAAWADLTGRRACDRKNPEHRWVMARRGALARRAQAIERGRK